MYKNLTFTKTKGEVIFLFERRTDLAIEARDIYRESKKADEIPGIETEETGDDEVRITRVRVVNEEGASAIGKKQGSYITIDAPALRENNPEAGEKITNALKDELQKLLGDCEKKIVLVAGLGNSRITPDSIGPRVVSNTVVTRHLFSSMPEEFCNGLSHVCAIAPGVLGITGIETGEIVKGIAEKVHPDIIIAVDALASRKMDRVSTTIQIADTGISPGSGVGNRRKALDSETLGIPVIAIGVPMVVDAATIAYDILDELPIDDDKKNALVGNVIPDKSTMVTPKEIDAIAERISKILANGINFALHKDLTAEDVGMFVG